MWIHKGATLIRGQRLFETRRLLEEIQYVTKYQRMDQVKFMEDSLYKI